MKKDRFTQALIFSAVLLLTAGGLFAWIGSRSFSSGRWKVAPTGREGENDSVYMEWSSLSSATLDGDCLPMQEMEQEAVRGIAYNQLAPFQAQIAEWLISVDGSEADGLEEAASFLAELDRTDKKQPMEGIPESAVVSVVSSQIIQRVPICLPDNRANLPRLYLPESVPAGNPLNSAVLFYAGDLMPVQPLAFLDEKAAPVLNTGGLFLGLISLFCSLFRIDAACGDIFPFLLRSRSELYAFFQMIAFLLNRIGAVLCPIGEFSKTRESRLGGANVRMLERRVMVLLI